MLSKRALMKCIVFVILLSSSFALGEPGSDGLGGFHTGGGPLGPQEGNGLRNLLNSMDACRADSGRLFAMPFEQQSEAELKRTLEKLNEISKAFSPVPTEKPSNETLDK